jgi:hypothetical protein
MPRVFNSKNKNNILLWSLASLLVVVILVCIAGQYFLRKETFADVDSNKMVISKILIKKGFATSVGEAYNAVEKLLVVDQAEVFKELGINYKLIPDSVKSQFVKFDMNEVLAVMKQHILIGEFGEEIGMNELVVPASYLNTMRKKLQNPESVRLVNTFEANNDEKYIYPYKKCVIGNVSYKTNILNKETSDLNMLSNDTDAVKNKKNVYGCIVEFTTMDQFKNDLINIYIHSDNENITKIRKFMREFKRTNDDREHAFGLFVESDKTNKEWMMKRDTSLRELAVDNARYRDQLKASDIAFNRLRESTANLNDANNRWWMNQNYGYRPLA